ncbi:MAG: hypothetical protein K9H26_19310 [Prolixibacteraceae bacterium]|nr:hypothetical protein [Prolixibacteraceae bacterium]
MKNTKIFALILILLFLGNTTVKAQEYSLKGRWNIKAGYSQYYDPIIIEKTHNYRLEINYGFFDFAELGGYIGYSNFRAFPLPNHCNNISPHTYTSSIYTSTPSLGIQGNFHIFPLFLKTRDFLVDLYISGKIGGLKHFSPENYYPNNYKLEYGLYGGMNIHLFQYAGFFVEYGYGNLCNFRFGLSVKF